MIFHYTTQSEWDAAQESGVYLPKNFADDGFIHCSDNYQLRFIANRLFLDTPNLICLAINADAVKEHIVYENLEGGEMPFPHIYGPLPVSAVEKVYVMQKDESGKIILPDELASGPVPLITLLPVHLPGTLYRSPTPGSWMFDPDDEIFDKYLKAGINVVVVLSPADELKRNTGRDLFKRYADAGIEVIHAPTADFSAPEKGYWDGTIAQAIQHLNEGKNLAVHCHAGLGRAGIFIACMVQDILGLDPEQAVEWTRQYIPRAVDTYLQRQFVRDYKKA